MPDIILKFSEELESKSKEEKIDLFEKEVDRFSLWISNLQDQRVNGPLSKSERALVKTYLVQKYLGKIDG